MKRKMLTISSMAKDPQGSDRLFQGTAKVLRNAVQTVPVCFECDQ